MPPPGYRASVVRADPHSVEYDNGVVLPRDGFAHEDANIFEGIQAAPPEPMGGTSAGPMLAWNDPAERPSLDALRAFNFASQQTEAKREDAPVDVQPAGVTRPYDRYADMNQGPSSLGGLRLPPSGDPNVDTRQPAQTPYVAPPPPEGVGYRAAQPAALPGGAQAQYGGGGGGGSRRVSVTTQRGTLVDPALVSQRRVAMGAEQDAIGDVAQAQQNAGRQDAALSRETADAQAIREFDRGIAEENRAKASAMAEDTYKQAVSDFGKRTVDPAGWYHDRGTGGTITAAIAMGLGAFGASLTGGPNSALDIIQSAIRDDIDAQKANINTAGKALDAQEGILAEMRRRFGDERQAEAAAEAAQLRIAATKAEELEAMHRANGAQPAGDLLSAQLRQRSVDREIDIGQIGAAQTSRTVASASGGGGGGGARMGAGGTSTIEIPGARISDLTRAQSIRPMDRQGVADTVANLQSFDRTLADMQALRRQHGAEIMDRTAVARARGLQQDAIDALSTARNAGTINAGEYDRYVAQVPDPTGFDWGTGSVDEGLAQLRRSGRSRLNQRLLVNGYTIDLPEEGDATRPGSLSD